MTVEGSKLNVPKIAPIAEGVNRPFWSVMIPTYNCTDYLIQTLKSILAQALDPQEMQIEIVDDCSTRDDPETVVKEIGEGRVSFFRQPRNVGAPNNFSACIQRAKGQWVHILHGDDTVLPGFYSSFQEAIEKEPTLGAAFCRHIYMNEKGHWSFLSQLERETPGILSNYIERLGIFNRLMTPSIVVKRKVYEELGGFNSELFHSCDWDMWKRIAVTYPIWYEPQPLACYRQHSTSDTSRLMSSGANIADGCQSITISELYLPKTIATKLSSKAREHHALYAFQTAYRMFNKGETVAAIAQIREGIKCSQSPKVIKSILALFQEIADNFYQFGFLPIDALDQFLAALQESFQKQQESTVIEKFKLKDINLIIFPDWEQSEELLYQDLANVITSLVNHPNKKQITLLLHTGNLSEDEASLFLSDVVMNLLMQENLDVTDDPEISLIGQLGAREWETLLPRIQARIILLKENQEAISQANAYLCKSVQVENIPVFEINTVVN